jgi:outer membrane protein TolC
VRKLSIAILTMVVTLSGCSVGPHYKAPNPAEVKLHQARPSEISQEKFDGKWWGQLDDPVLNGLVDSALRSNWDIEVARARLAQSRAIYDERKLDKYPTISSTASYQQSREVFPGFTNNRSTSRRTRRVSTRTGSWTSSGACATR